MVGAGVFEEGPGTQRLAKARKGHLLAAFGVAEQRRDVQGDDALSVKQRDEFAHVIFNAVKAVEAKVAVREFRIFRVVASAGSGISRVVPPVVFDKAAALQVVGLLFDPGCHIRTELAVGGDVLRGRAETDIDGIEAADESQGKMSEGWSMGRISASGASSR